MNWYETWYQCHKRTDISNFRVLDSMAGEITRRVGDAENAGVEKAGVEKSGVDSRGGKCRSDNGWKAVTKEKYKIPVV